MLCATRGAVWTREAAGGKRLCVGGARRCDGRVRAPCPRTREALRVGPQLVAVPRRR